MGKKKEKKGKRFQNEGRVGKRKTELGR